MKPKFAHWQWLASFAAIVLVLTGCDSEDVPVLDMTDQPHTVALIHSVSNFVTASEALDVAGQFYAANNNGAIMPVNRSSSSPETIHGSDRKTLAYIINYDGGGWVIVSATKTYYPVLAHSDEGSFSIESPEQNSGVMIWVEELTHAIEASSSLDAQKASHIAMEWLVYEPQTLASGLPGGNSPEAVACRARLKQLNETYYTEGWSFTTLPYASVTVPQDVYAIARQNNSPEEYTIIGVQRLSVEDMVGPLMTTKWNQVLGFNAKCPLYNPAEIGKNPAGCVAVAMAQIMKFHEFASANFNWTAMDDNIPTTATCELIADVGQKAKVQYGYEESPAYDSNAAEAFRKYGYNATLKNYNAQEVMNEILDYQRPVYMSGVRTGAKTGHAWVSDGAMYKQDNYYYYVEYMRDDNSYNNLGLTSIEYPTELNMSSLNLKFHMNFGWGGSQDGWFLNNALPDEVGYNNNRKVIFVSH